MGERTSKSVVSPAAQARYPREASDEASSHGTSKRADDFKELVGQLHSLLDELTARERKKLVAHPAIPKTPGFSLSLSLSLSLSS